ncbi:hypothetical protein [Streptomyces sp. NPDC007940]|uniref:hypothetical protein n=1 Tax=Streptomyces sp. NPDC007940 TaxID=3364796 RepID=UPI0036E3EE65
MADKVTQQLWERLKAGTSPSRFESPEPKGDATTREIQRQMRGDTDYSSIHEANAKGREEHERDVRRRTRALANQGVPHPEATARAQIQREARESAERDRRQQVFEAMSQSSERERERAKWEQRANRPVRPDGAPEPGTPYVSPDGQTARRDRVSERLMAQANGTVWNLYQQEEADNQLVSELQAITGAHR